MRYSAEGTEGPWPSPQKTILPRQFVPPLGLITAGEAGIVSTETLPTADDESLCLFASLRSIRWMMADLFSPVPAAFAPAFWTKNMLSLGGYHTAASWKSGSPAEVVSARRVSVGLSPIIA